MKANDRIWEVVARKLAGEISVKELQELEGYMEQNPDLHFSLEIILNEWSTSDAINSEDNQEYYQKHLERLQVYRERKKPLKRKLYLYISSAILVLFAAWLWSSSESEPVSAAESTTPQISYTVPLGKRTQFSLPDGTKVWLNSGSDLIYDFNGSNRIVYLTGEGFFEVFKNKKHPFLIHTPYMQIRVTGTSLNVKAYPEDSTEETALISGSVSIIHFESASEIRLKPREKLVLNKARNANENEKDGMIISERNMLKKTIINWNMADSSILETEWINNKLVFEDEDLDGLVVRFKRWYGVEILVENDRLKTKRFTGNFEHENVNQAIEALKITAGFNYSIMNDTIRIF